MWNSLTRSGFTWVCLFFLSRLPAPTSLSGSERRLGEDPENEFLSRLWFSKDGVHVKDSHYNKRFRIAFTANVKLYRVNKFSLYLSYTVYYSYTGISCFMLSSSSRLIVDNFFLLISNLKSYQLFNKHLTFAVCPERDSKSF